MFTVIGIMFGGIVVGYLLRKVELLQKIGKPISYTILLLLFLLGISVGANDAIVNNLTTLGGQAFLIALAGTTGSVLAAWGVYHFFFNILFTTRMDDTNLSVEVNTSTFHTCEERHL